MDVTHYSHTVDCDGLSVQYDLYCPGKAQPENGKNETLTLNENLTYEQKVLAFEQAYGEAQDEIERLTSIADGLDLTLAISSGIVAGLLDIFFVGEWNFAEAKTISNEQINRKIQDFAMKNGLEKWVEEKKNNPRVKKGYDINRLETAVAFLEETFPMPGDNTWKGHGINVSSSTHHLDDFKHHPTIVGLICSILDQFTRESTYHNRFGETYKIPMEVDENGMLEGKTPTVKVSAGIINWCINVAKQQQGHLMSDMAGSKNTAGAGMGLPGDFMSMLREMASLPGFKDTDFALKLTKAYQYGIGTGENQVGLGALNNLFEGASSKFDMRTELAIKHELKRQSIPVILNEIVVRTFYLVRHFVSELREVGDVSLIEWKKILPFKNRTIVRMLTISTGVMEVFDFADAGLRSGGNLGMFVLRVNFVGVGRFAVAGSVDILMGIKKNRLELAMSSAEVAKTAQATHSVIEGVEQRRSQTQSRLDQLTSKINGGCSSGVSDIGREFTVGYTINDLQVDSNIFTPEDAKEVAEHIFSLKSEEFQDLKNAAWYQRFLKAVTFRSGSKKLMISNITSLSKLQQFFLQIYAQHYNGLDQQLNQIIDAVENLDSKVSKLYSGLELQADIRQFSREEAGILQLLLCAYQSQNDREAEFQKYRGSVISIFGDVEPQGEFTPEMLTRYTGHHEVFCRCIYELAAIDGSLEIEMFPPIIKDALDHLTIAEVTKRNIKKAVMRQVSSFGIQYLTDEKYKSEALDLNGIEFKDCCEESGHPQIDQATIPDSESSGTDNSFNEITELVSNKYGLDAINTSTILPGKLFQTVFKGKDSSDEGAGKELQKICGQIYDEKHPCSIAPKTIIGAMKSTPIIFTTAGIHCNLGPKRGPMPQFISYKNIDFSRTSIMRDNSGNPSGIHLYSKDDRIVAYLPMNDPDTFISVLLTASKMHTATQDALLPMDQMPLDLKLAYSKVLILFCQEFDLDWVEALRMANDLSISKEDFASLFDYTQNIHTDADLRKQIMKLADNLPYPNEESVSTSLIEALIALIQFSTKRCREITIAERSFINRIGKMLGINDDMIQSLIPAAQLPYRLLRKDVKAEEVNGITQALTSAGALSLGTVAAIGLGTFAGGLVFNVTSDLLRHQKEKKDKKAMEEASQKQLAALKGSYHSLIKMTRGLPISDELSPMILKAAVRTSPSIPEYIRSCEINAFRAAQKTEPKDTSSQSRPCELRVYQVTAAEQKNCFSVTAKVNYAPVHKGDIFALLVNGCPSTRIIKVLQIGTGDRQWDEKDPDIISTFILDGIFTADELAGKTFIQIS